MRAKYEISIIIPTYNRSKLLSFTLDSLKHQRFPTDKFQVVVSDDGSTDDTREMLEAYENDINIEYVYQEDKGFRPASARNLGITACQGDVCLFIDSGVLLDENCLERHVRFHQKEQNGAAIGYVYGFQESEQTRLLLQKLIDLSQIGRSIEEIDSNPAFHDMRDAHYIKYNYHIENLPAPWLYFWTNHVSVSTEKLRAIGGFDENYDGKWGAEDVDLGFRLYTNGMKICLLKTATSIHYPHPKNDEKKVKDGFQNCMYFHQKFQTKHTKLLLDNYLSSSFVDINELGAHDTK